MIKILLVEDEPAMRRGLKDNLEVEGYEVDIAADGTKGLQALVEQRYSLAILDVMLPGMSGFDVCKKAREQGINVPILMLTAKGQEIDKVVGLELGADDYMTKPFSLRELLARVKALLRRAEGTSGATGGTITLGSVKVDFDAYTASRDGVSLPMTPKEVDVLHYFWQNRNKTVSRDDLLNKVWGYDASVTSRTVDNFILKLRQKIEIDPANPKYIITIHGVGYKFVVV
jgi:DNA-binding response OmpR family regulator